MTYLPGCACYRCVFKEVPVKGTVPTSAEVGILGAVPGAFGSLQAAEAVKFILGKGKLLTNRILTADLLTMDFRTISVKLDPNCKADHPA
jgi:molybdopterin/thiamine biosynthesis adenylyltransferase